MHVLHVLDHSVPLQSGYSFRTLSILREQRRRGWVTDQLTSQKHRSTALVEDAEGVRFHRTPATSTLWPRVPVARQVEVVRSLERRLKELVVDLRPDVIHAHSPALNGAAACRVGHALRVPVVYEVRAFWEDAAVDLGTSRAGGLRYQLTRALETWVMKRASAITTICEGLASEITSRGIPPSKVTVIPNAVDVEKFEVDRAPDGALAERLGLAGAQVVGFVGSFYAYEGLDLLLSGLPALFRKHPGVRVLLVGGGPQAEALGHAARRLGVADRVVFPGRVPFDEVQSYYDLIDVLVYPRHPMRLTDLVTPLKPLEAMAMGKLVVASDVGGHRELIRDGETGLLFQAGDRADLTRVLERALTEPHLGQRLRRAGRRFVEQERTWEASVARYAPVYSRLVEGRRET